jgi:hypothetical protein
MDGKCDPPSEEDPDEPRMGGIPDQVEGCEPNNHDDEDRDKEAAHWWFRELQPLRRRTRSSRHGFLDSSACKQDSRSYFGGWSLHQACRSPVVIREKYRVLRWSTLTNINFMWGAQC